MSSHESLSPSSLTKEDQQASGFTPEELREKQSLWQAQLFSENPQLLSLRERVLEWTHSYSLGNAVHTNLVSSITHVNRHKILELVYQHLVSIGMFQTAESIQKESGHSFSYVSQKWDQTDLLYLVSLGVLSREDPWKVTQDTNHVIVEESIEEDYFASPYKEPYDYYPEYFDHDLGGIYSSEEHNLSTLKTTSLRHLVILLLSLRTENISDQILVRFFVSLHTITSSSHFLEHLLTLFDLNIYYKEDEEKCAQILKTQASFRRSIINFVKRWIAYQGLFIGKKTLKQIKHFLRRIADNPVEYKGLEFYATATLNMLPTLTYGMKNCLPPDPSDPPIVPDSQILFRPGLKLTDPDPVETARQICMIYNKAFSGIHTREFLLALELQQVSHRTPTIAEFLEFGERLQNFCIQT